MKLRINLSKVTFAAIFTAVLFILLIVTAALFGPFKENVQLVLLFVGIMAFTSLFARAQYKTSIPFYLLLLILFYIAYSYWVTLLADILIPKPEHPYHVSSGWIWGLLSALLLTPVSLRLYHRINRRNIMLEAALAASFIIVMAIHLLF